MSRHPAVDEALDAWLQDVAGWLALPALKMNPAGACAVLFSGRVHVTFQVNPQAPQELWLLSDLGAAPADAQLYAVFLRGNLLWQGTAGATLGLSADDPARLVIATRLAWRGMAHQEVAAILENFVSACEHWSGRLAERSSQAPPAPLANAPWPMAAMA